MTHVLYTDGSCLGNPGRGGWAFCCVRGSSEYTHGGNDALTTNNKMELTAVIQGLKYLESIQATGMIEIYTDSQYVKNGSTVWMENWKKRDWKQVKNVELWKELDVLISKFKIKWNWVKAHTNKMDKHSMYNDLVDQRARMEAMNANQNH